MSRNARFLAILPFGKSLFPVLPRSVHGFQSVNNCQKSRISDHFRRTKRDHARTGSAGRFITIPWRRQNRYDAPMSSVTNLNRFRKHKARADKRARADENAVRFGRTKAEKQADDAANAAAQRHLDGHRRDEQDS